MTAKSTTTRKTATRARKATAPATTAVTEATTTTTPAGVAIVTPGSEESRQSRVVDVPADTVQIVHVDGVAYALSREDRRQAKATIDGEVARGVALEGTLVTWIRQGCPMADLAPARTDTVAVVHYRDKTSVELTAQQVRDVSKSEKGKFSTENYLKAVTSPDEATHVIIGGKNRAILYRDAAGWTKITDGIAAALGLTV